LNRAGKKKVNDEIAIDILRKKEKEKTIKAVLVRK
jgi:hypothetical protein